MKQSAKQRGRNKLSVQNKLMKVQKRDSKLGCDVGSKAAASENHKTKLQREKKQIY